MAEIVDCGTHCELVLRNRAGVEAGRALFDKRHCEKVRPLVWNLHHSGAPRNQRHLIYLHQLIMGARPGYEVDHRNGNRLDNLDANLRWATRTQNSRNLPLSKRNRSGCKGVWWDEKNKAWQVKICVDRRQLFLGRFKDYDEAKLVRQQAEKKYYGEFARVA
jgi:hypothetical protein